MSYHRINRGRKLKEENDFIFMSTCSFTVPYLRSNMKCITSFLRNKIKCFVKRYTDIVDNTLESQTDTIVLEYSFFSRIYNNLKNVSLLVIIRLR